VAQTVASRHNEYLWPINFAGHVRKEKQKGQRLPKSEAPQGELKIQLAGG